MHKKILLCLITVLPVVAGITQGNSLFGGSNIGISYTYQPNRKLTNTNGSYQFHSVGINSKIPLFGNRATHPGHFYQTSLLADLHNAPTTFGYTANNRNFINGSLGLSTIIFSGHKNIFLINAAMGLAADEDVINKKNADLRFTGSFIVNNLHSMKTMYLYGITFTYAFGRPLPLPVLGIRTKISKSWTFSTILPVEISFMNRLNAKTGLAFSIHPSGNRFQFDNQTNFSSLSSTVYLQLREFLLSSSVNYRFAHDFSVNGEVGMLFGGRLNFTEQEDNKKLLFESGVKPGAMFRIAVRYHIPGKKTVIAKEMTDILNPLGY